MDRNHLSQVSERRCGVLRIDVRTKLRSHVLLDLGRSQSWSLELSSAYF